MDFSVLLILGLILFFGYLGGLLANRIGLPKVSGYVLLGIFLSPSVTGIISKEFLKSSSVIVDFALAMVAFDLGGNLRACLKNLVEKNSSKTYIQRFSRD